MEDLSTMKRVIKHNPRYQEYLDYLEDHITGVQRSWNEMLKPYVEENYKDTDVAEISRCIALHDSSKYMTDEFDPYCNYFYPSEGFEKDEEAFDLAWLLHQHRNPHHPQHWVLVRDEGQLVPLDMPFEYICEMLCDWHSFSLRDPKSTAYKWYIDNHENMQLSDNTIKIVEDLIEALQEPLLKS